MQKELNRQPENKMGIMPVDRLLLFMSLPMMGRNIWHEMRASA